jgi:cytochrome c-type biogenesis protein CcmH/NrfF
MRKQLIFVTCILLLFVLAGVLLAACGSSSPATTSAGGTANGSTSAGQILLQQRCTVCHSANRVTSTHHTAAEWKNTVDRMINKGAQLSSTEEQTLINYLAQNYK